MATNREMLKEAIAEAKAVKEMAIANAKAAIEESFTPQLKSILSAKLQEMEEEEMEENLDEAGFGKAREEGDEGFSSMGEKSLDEEELEEDLDLNELLGELNEEESEEEESEESEEEGEPIDLEDMTDEDLKKMIEDVIADMVAAGELEAGHEGEGEEEEMEMEPEAEEEEEEINLDELLAEIEGLDEDMEEEGMMYDEDMMDEDLYEAENTSDMGDALEGAVESGELEKADLAAALQDAKEVAANISEALDKEELKAEIDLLKKKSSIQKIASTIGYSAAAVAGGLLVAGIFKDAPEAISAGADQVIDMSKEALVGFFGVLAGLGLGIGKSAQRYGTQQAIASKEKQLSKELEEAYSTIETLRSELNEVNLLNAKLLYTNKIFKAKTLTENQKLNVLSSFDKAVTVKEVKLVYETLSEGLKSKTSKITENLGSASKPVGTATKQPIVESDDMVKRFQKLAGII